MPLQDAEHDGPEVPWMAGEPKGAGGVVGRERAVLENLTQAGIWRRQGLDGEGGGRRSHGAA
jgi:hypothetical protein